MKSALVRDRFFHFVCRAPAHQESTLFVADAISAPNPITLHEAQWSYCASGTRDGHDWLQTRTGETLEEVKREVQHL